MTPADETERQLAVATESIRQLRADVELATAERDAEAARAFEAETERDALRTLLRSIGGAWEEAPASHRHEVSTLLPSLAQALQTAREGRNAEWWTRE